MKASSFGITVALFLWAIDRTGGGWILDFGIWGFVFVVVYRNMGIGILMLDEMFPLEGNEMRSVQLLYLQWVCFSLSSLEESLVKL